MTAPQAAARSRVRAVAWTLLFFLGGTLLTLAALLAISVALPGSLQGARLQLEMPGPVPILVQSVSVIAGFGLMTVLFVRRGLGWRDLRWTGVPRLRGFALGFALGGAIAGLALLIAVGPGGASFSSDEGTLLDWLGKAALTTALLAPAALSEELVFRGVPLVVLAAAFGRRAALVGLAVLFALLHAPNPNASPLGLANIAVAGVFLGLAFYAPGGIWTAFGAHLGWNATLAVLDAPVSGLPFQIPLLDYHPGAPTWLTGGAFGPEGGLSATIAMALGTAVAARWAQQERIRA